MATPSKKPTSKVEPDKRSRTVVQADNAEARPPTRRRKAVVAATSETTDKRSPAGESKPTRGRRKAEAKAPESPPAREPDSMDLSAATHGQASFPTAQAQDSQPTHEQIAERAYHIFLSRGGQHGHHDEDWRQAERELCANDG